MKVTPLTNKQKPKKSYHFCAMYQPEPGIVSYYDGIITTDILITPDSGYSEFKDEIIKSIDGAPPEQITLFSLNLIS